MTTFNPEVTSYESLVSQLERSNAALMRERGEKEGLMFWLQEKESENRELRSLIRQALTNEGISTQDPRIQALGIEA